MVILFLLSVNFRWFFCWFIVLIEEIDKLFILKIGLEKFVLKGFKWFILWIFLIVILFFVNNIFICFMGFNEVVLDNFFIYLFKFLVNDFIFLIFIVIFVVIWWLLNLVINFWCVDSILNIDIWLIDLVEFFVWFCFLLIFKINVGKVNVLIIFEVIIFKIFLC